MESHKAWTRSQGCRLVLFEFLSVMELGIYPVDGEHAGEFAIPVNELTRMMHLPSSAHPILSAHFMAFNLTVQSVVRGVEKYL